LFFVFWFFSFLFAFVGIYVKVFFRGRIMRFSYGVATVMPFDANVHSADKKITIPGRSGFWCKDYFDKFVTAGDEVEVDSFVVSCIHAFHPHWTCCDSVDWR